MNPISKMDNVIESLGSNFVENGRLKEDAENELAKNSAFDDEQDHANNHKSGNDRVENDTIDESDGGKGDQKDKRGDIGEEGYISENEDETPTENRKTDFTHLPLDVLRLVIDFSKDSEKITSTNKPTASSKYY